jgi:hypothetical protein
LNAATCAWKFVFAVGETKSDTRSIDILIYSSGGGNFRFQKTTLPAIVIQRSTTRRVVRVVRDHVITRSQFLRRTLNSTQSSKHMSSFDITNAELLELLETLQPLNLSPSLQRFLSKVQTAQDAAWANSDFGLEPAPITVNLNNATPSQPWQGIVSNVINLLYVPCDIYYYLLFFLGPSSWLAWVPVLLLVLWNISVSPNVLQLTVIT